MTQHGRRHFKSKNHAIPRLQDFPIVGIRRKPILKKAIEKKLVSKGSYKMTPY